MKNSSANLQRIPNESDLFATLLPVCDITERRVKKIVQHMRQNLSERMTLKSVAALAGVSTRHFTRLFQAETECAPMDYLRLLRLAQACHLLGNSWLRVKEICQQVGFADESNFMHEFKKQMGCTPCEWREKVMTLKNRVHFYQ